MRKLNPNKYYKKRIKKDLEIYIIKKKTINKKDSYKNIILKFKSNLKNGKFNSLK